MENYSIREIVIAGNLLWNESLGKDEYGFPHFGMKNGCSDGPYTRFLTLLLLAQGG